MNDHVASTAPPDPDEGGTGNVAALFVASSRGGVPVAVTSIEAIAGIGLRGDRWGDLRPPGRPRRCQVTLIEAEHLIAAGTAFADALASGRHRRNIVTRGIRLASLAGHQFRIGNVLLRYDRKRPPCRHLDAVAEAPLSRSLAGWGGICATVEASGIIRLGDVVCDAADAAKL